MKDKFIQAKQDWENFNQISYLGAIYFVQTTLKEENDKCAISKFVLFIYKRKEKKDKIL